MEEYKRKKYMNSMVHLLEKKVGLTYLMVYNSD